MFVCLFFLGFWLRKGLRCNIPVARTLTRGRKTTNMAMIYFPSSHQIEHLQKGEYEFLRQFIVEQKIEKVDFSHKDLDAATALNIVYALKGLNVKVLNFGYNHLGSEGAVAIAKELKNTQIQELDLTQNSIGAAVVDVIKALSSTSIKVVKLAYNHVGKQGLRAAAPLLMGSELKADLSHNKSWL